MKTMNHGEYQRKLRSKEESELRFIIKDAAAAIAAQPLNPNNSYYQDEINYCAMELYKRKQS